MPRQSHGSHPGGASPLNSNVGQRGCLESIIVMVYTVAVVLLIIWRLGPVCLYIIGGFIHGLLVPAIVVVLLRIIRGQKPV